MQAIQRFRTAFVIIAALFALAQFTPVVAQVEDDDLAAAPAIPSSNDYYVSPEDVRAAIGAPAEPVTITNQVPSDVRWAPAGTVPTAPALGANRDATAVYAALNHGPSRANAPSASIEANRLIAAHRALASGDLGGMQEEALAAYVAAAASWDDTSGYGAVEANRAAFVIAAPVGPSWDETTGYAAVEANRVAIARLALESDDLGSMQEQALAELVAASKTWDETSGYGYVEASRSASGGK